MRLFIVLAMTCFAVLTSTVVHGQGALPDVPAVTKESDALLILARARSDLAAMGLTIPREIPLKFRTRDELMVENNGGGGLAMELDGFYRPYNPEELWIVSGKSPAGTLSVMAHELTHAWQTTNSPLQDRKLKEGFARWVEYKVMMSEGFPARAQSLTQDPNEDYGGGLRALLEIEAKEGVSGVMETARTKTKLE